MIYSKIGSRSINSKRKEQNTFKVTLVTFILLLSGLFASNITKAQVNINISSQALWGPTGYDYVEYYYLPGPDVYYYVPTGQFIYPNGPNWTYATYLPATYHVNLYNTYKVIINEPKPYLQHNVYFVKYGKYKHGGPKQLVIRDSRDAKYYVVKGHPQHGQANGNGNNGQPHNSNNMNNHNAQNNHSQSENPSHKPEGHSENHGSNGGGNNGGGNHSGGGNGNNKKH